MTKWRRHLGTSSLPRGFQTNEEAQEAVHGQGDSLLFSSDSEWSDTDVAESPTPDQQNALLALRSEIQNRIQELQDGSEKDFLLGCAVLELRKQTRVHNAYGAFERLKRSADGLYEYESQLAHNQYRQSCTKLQREMDDEICREIRRLENTRDGVSVMDRRRLTRHAQQSASSGEPQTITNHLGWANGGQGAQNDSKNNVSPPSNGPLPSTRMYPLNPVIDGESSAASEAHEKAIQEQKELKALLDKPRVFPTLQKRAPAEQVTSDLNAITDQVGRVSSSFVPSQKPFQHDQPNRVKRRKLNPKMLQEGQKVTLLKATDDEWQEVVSGTIISATKSMVYLQTRSEQFEKVPIEDIVRQRVRLEPTDNID